MCRTISTAGVAGRARQSSLLAVKTVLIWSLQWDLVLGCQISDRYKIVGTNNEIVFVCKPMASWYDEHLRAYKLSHVSTFSITHDVFPLSLYRSGGRQLITLQPYSVLSYVPVNVLFFFSLRRHHAETATSDEWS